MPYIDSEKRAELLVLTKDGKSYENYMQPTTPGELNFLITHLCKEYLKDDDLSYQLLNDIIGALEGAKMEFYRRIAVPYEDKKIIENGDVYK